MTKAGLALLLSFAAASCAPRVATAPSKPNGRDKVVVAAVADVRAKPSPHSGKYEFDPDQETQVVRGERVIALETKDGWTRVECPEQPEFTHNNRWEGYPGWVPSDALEDDDEAIPRLQEMALSESALRAFILKQAERHLNEAYLWGGRSVHDPSAKGVLTGVDCSGLVNLSFRQAGRVVPRDAHEQYMKARRVAPAKLKPADLIFLAKAEKPDRIVHVMFYAGDGFLLEAPQTGERVRRMKISDRFGKKLDELKEGEAVDGRILHFGSLIGGQ